MSLLFVYGTLMQGYPENPFQQWLQEHANFLGKGFTKGALYKVDYYPGMIQGDGEVKGEVYQLHEPEERLRILDEYEDYFPDRPEESLYIREKGEVTLFDSRQSQQCWMYIYNKEIAEFPRYPNDEFTW